MRLATLHDVRAIMSLIDQARVVLATHNSGQWQGKEPSLETIINDINHRHYWVIEEHGQIIAGAALLPLDEDYHTLKEGSWINQEPYRVIHRLVVDVNIHRQGVGQRLLKELERITLEHYVYNIKVDTHRKNIPMINLLKKSGYIRCGVVNLKGNLLREAFQKVMR